MIFCVEDDAGIRDIEVYTLQSTGFAAQGLPDGEALWTALRQQRPDLILLDVMLPKMIGFDVPRSRRRRSLSQAVRHDGDGVARACGAAPCAPRADG